MSEFHFSPRENKADLINWRRWGDEAFQQAKAEDKLVLLSIGAVWCHWCHVMDEKAYSDQKNIELINERFIPIKIDNDKQPDVNRRYNMGGWPTTAVLTPQGQLLEGATYLPPEKLYQFLEQIDQVFHQKRDEIEEKIRAYHKEQEERLNRVQESDLTGDKIEHIQSTILQKYDDEYGGFGMQPKFPYPEVLDFLLNQYFRTKDKELEGVIDKTLTNMSREGMFDQEVGGFFRYSTTRDWTIPHFEKLLQDNSKLLGVYLKAFQIFNKGGYKEVVLDVISYMQDWMIDHQRRLFYGSQDADEEYYKLTRTERQDVEPPFVDKTIYISWNGMAISSFLKAFALLDALECKEIALKGLDFLMENCFVPGEGMHHYYTDGQGYNTNLLEDQMTITSTLLEAYQITHKHKYLDRAKELSQIILERFYDVENGGFFVDIPSDDRLELMTLEDKPITINSCMAELFLKLETVTGEERYRQIAEATLKLCAGQYQEYGLFAAPFGRALGAYLDGFTHITIIGNEKDNKTKKLFQESLKMATPYKIVEKLDPLEDKERIETLGYNPEEKKAYVCKGKNCFPPTDNLEELSNRVLARD